MGNNRIRVITYGAMIAALSAVFGLANLVSGGIIDVLFSYILTMAVFYYSYRFGNFNGFVTATASFLLLLLIGIIFFAVFTYATMFLGIIMAWLLNNRRSYRMCTVVLTGAGALKNLLIFNLMAKILGIDMQQETFELLRSFNIGIDLMGIIYWTTPAVIGFMEATMVNNYSRLVLTKIRKYHQRGR